MKSWWRKAPEAANDERLALEPGGAERALRRLEWTVIRRLDGLLQGDYRTLMRGSGLDLADLREYQHHDDVRHIDCERRRAAARSPHVRVFTEDREMAAWFVLDLSRSVDFGSGARRPSARYRPASSACWRACSTRHGNRVGALVYGRDLEAVIPPRTGRRPCAAPAARDGKAREPGRSRAHAGAARRAWPTCWTAARTRSCRRRSHRLRRLRLPQRARLGAPAGPAGAAARGGGRAPVRPARARAARPRPGAADATPKPASSCRVDTHDARLPQALRAAGAPSARRTLRESAGPGRRRRPRTLDAATTWSRPSCASPTCASRRGVAPAWRPGHGGGNMTLPLGPNSSGCWLALAAAAAPVPCLAAAPQEEAGGPLRQPLDRARGHGARARACGATSRRCLFLLAMAALLVAAARADGRGAAALEPADHHPGDGRAGQHARRRRAAQPAGGGAGPRPRASSRTCRATVKVGIVAFAGSAQVAQLPAANRERPRDGHRHLPAAARHRHRRRAWWWRWPRCFPDAGIGIDALQRPESAQRGVPIDQAEQGTQEGVRARRPRLATPRPRSSC